PPRRSSRFHLQLGGLYHPRRLRLLGPPLPGDPPLDRGADDRQRLLALRRPPDLARLPTRRRRPDLAARRDRPPRGRRGAPPLRGRAALRRRGDRPPRRPPAGLLARLPSLRPDGDLRLPLARPRPRDHRHPPPRPPAPPGAALADRAPGTPDRRDLLL